ncbi:MAG: LCP family protein [Anaerolineae bacterium]|nr:LCP family protein [Anaerolineae bacterium]
MLKNRYPNNRGRTAPTLVTALILLLFLAVLILATTAVLQWFRGTLSIPGLFPVIPGRGSSQSENIDYQFGQLLPTWTGTDRVTVLLLGIDERSQQQGPWRTDTLMLLTLDPVTKEAGVLSIPRDLWVPIPGYNDGRINTAHFLGELYNHSGGGPGLAVETVEYNLGVQVNYYVRLNFSAFVRMIDLIGGVDIYVEESINDPLYPDANFGYDPLIIEAGWHHFNGEMTLKYARTRHNSNDFDRARRQQQVIDVLLERVTSLELLPDLARNASDIYQLLGTGIQTDFALDQILALANIASNIERSTIRYGVLDENATQPWVTPEGAQVLIPIRDEMRKIRDYVFNTASSMTGTPGETGGGLLPTPTMEVATVAVLNGTTRNGLAGETAEYLRSKGFDVVAIANADRQDYSSSLILVNRDRPVTVARLLKQLNLSPTAVIKGSDATVAQDITIVLGADYVNPSQN